MNPENTSQAGNLQRTQAAGQKRRITILPIDPRRLYAYWEVRDDSIEAAHASGMRFVATRGAMTVGRSGGGLPPDGLVEREDDALRDAQRLIERYHDPSHGAMVQVAVAPCSPFSVSTDFMKESARLARACGVRMHTHLAENDHDVAYSQEKFGRTPAQYAEDLGWVGDDVWHAHCVKLEGGSSVADPDKIRHVAQRFELDVTADHAVAERRKVHLRHLLRGFDNRRTNA